MLRNLARRLLVLLLLLALIAGGQSSSAMAVNMDMGKVQTGDMDQDCQVCGAPIAAPCDVICAALPALDVAAFGIDELSAHERWGNHSGSGVSIFITPDTSPPRD